jgi:glycosyltransferase involved in cell wall biosynthesis
MKKVLIVHNKYIEKGGEDSVVQNEYKLLLNNGVPVKLLLFDNELLESKGYIRTFRNLLYNESVIKKIGEEIDTFKPNIVHIHNLFYLISPGLIRYLKKRNIQIIMTLHNYRLICPSAILFNNGVIYETNIDKKFPFDGIFKGVFQNSVIKTLILSVVIWGHRWMGTWYMVDKYILLSEFAKEKIMKSTLNISEQSIYVKSNFVREPQISSLEHHNKRQFIYIGRLNFEKGVQTLLEVFKKNKQYKILIYGDGILKEEVENAQATSENIIYKGFQSHEILIKDLIESRALIFPSIWYETFGMSIIESFSVGTPVIVSSLGNLINMVDDKKNGFLFEPNNSDALTERIEAIINMEDDDYSQMRKSAKKDYLEKYSEIIGLENLLNIYEARVKKN